MNYFKRCIRLINVNSRHGYITRGEKNDLWYRSLGRYLANSGDVEVLATEWLRDEMKGIIKEMMLNYAK